MKTYRLDPTKLPKQKRNILLLYCITFLIMIAISLGLNWGKPTISSLKWMIPLMLAMFAYSGYQAYRQRKLLWEEYSLEIGDDYLAQSQPRYPELRLPLTDLTSIDEKRFGLLISAKQGRNILAITKDLSEADYVEVKAILTVWLEKKAEKEDSELGQDDTEPEQVDYEPEQDDLTTKKD